MKNIFKKEIIILFICAFFIFGQSINIVNIKGDIITDEAFPPDLNIIKSDRQGTSINVSLNGFNIQDFIISDTSYHSISIPNQGYISEIGKPKIPTIRIFLTIPPDSTNIQLSYINSQSYQITGINIIPNQMPLSELENSNNFTINTSFYSKNEFYPSEIVSIISEGWIGDYRHICLQICPIIFNPYLKIVSISNNININIEYESDDESFKSYYKTGFEKRYEPIFLNYKYSNEWYKSVDFVQNIEKQKIRNLNDSSNRAGLLIITNDTFYDTLEPLVNWKDRKGFETYIAKTSEVYSTYPATNQYDSIKLFIQYAFNNWTRAPSHVLLIGDVEYIPTYYYSSSTATDHWYSCVSGGDYFSDVLIGRISVKNNTELSNVINKILEYETNPYLNETDWYKKAMLVSDSGYFEVTSDWIYDFLTEQRYTLDKFYASQGTATTSNVANAINEGRAIANYRGHGGITGWATSSFYNGNVHALTNGRMQPIVISPTCLTGHYDDSSQDCFGESWLKAVNGGGVTFWGSSRVSYGGYNDQLAMGVYKAIFNDQITDFGGFTNMAKMYMYNEYGPTSTCLLELNLFNVIGDSTLEFWTEIPTNLNVSFPSIIPPEYPNFDITVTFNNTPIEEALVCLQKDNELYTYGYTNETGVINFNINESLSIGTMNLTVTKHNYIPYFNEIYVTNQAPEISQEYASPITQENGNNVNITCNVVDNIQVNQVIINITDPLENETSNTMNQLTRSNNYYYNASYSIDGLYKYTITAEDNEGNKESSIIHFFYIGNDGVSNTITLETGWNLISTSIEFDFMASEIAESIEGCLTVNKWDNINQTYKPYIVGGPPDFDFQIKPGIGLFVEVENSAEIILCGSPALSPSVNLEIPWNLLGWYNKTPTTASSLSENITGCLTVNMWDSVNQTYKPYIVVGPPDFDFTIYEGMGLFIEVDIESTWNGEG